MNSGDLKTAQWNNDYAAFRSGKKPRLIAKLLKTRGVVDHPYRAGWFVFWEPMESGEAIIHLPMTPTETAAQEGRGSLAMDSRTILSWPRCWLGI